jgi:hypothetical protein
MAALPIPALLTQLRAPSGARLPDDVTTLVASFATRTGAFGSMPYPFGRLVPAFYGGFYAPLPNRDEVVSYDEMRQRIYRYIFDGETVGGPRVVDNDIGWKFDHYNIIKEYGIRLVMFLGLEDLVTLRSIFLPPTSSGRCRRRSLFLCFDMGLSLSGISHDWTKVHGKTPEVIEWRADCRVWHALWTDGQ